MPFNLYVINLAICLLADLPAKMQRCSSHLSARKPTSRIAFAVYQPVKAQVADGRSALINQHRRRAGGAFMDNVLLPALCL